MVTSTYKIELVQKTQCGLLSKKDTSKYQYIRAAKQENIAETHQWDLICFKSTYTVANYGNEPFIT